MSNRIIVLEDSLLKAKQLQTYFAAQGHEVVIVNPSQSAVALIEQINPAVILIAEQLSDANSFKLCKTLKRSFRLRSVPVIMYNAEYNDRQMTKAYKAGADFYLMKGQENDRLLQVVVETVFKHQPRKVSEPIAQVTPFAARRPLTA